MRRFFTGAALALAAALGSAVVPDAPAEGRPGWPVSRLGAPDDQRLSAARVEGVMAALLPKAVKRPDLDALIEQSKQTLARMAPGEIADLREQQRQSWARGEAELAKDPRTR